MARPRYIRHRKFNRIRHSRRLLKWLEEQATRLSVTEEALFNLMVGNRFSFQAVESLTTFPEVPENLVPPAITGAPEVGQTLTVTPGTWSGEPTPTLTYQWFRGDKGDETNAIPIPGATGLTYELTEEDEGSVIFVRETAVNRVGAMFADSDPTAVISA